MIAEREGVSFDRIYRGWPVSRIHAYGFILSEARQKLTPPTMRLF